MLGNFTEKVDEGECNTPCKGNNNQTCGGPARINVYVSKELASLEPCGYQPPVSTTTPPTTTTTAPTSTSTLCVSTVTLPSKCEYGCGKWCASELPDWDDDSGCKNGVSNCKLQVSACFKKAGFPGAMECFEFSKWCNDIDSWRGSNCKHGKCKKSDCFKSKPPKNHKPPTTTTTHVPCKPTTTTSSRPTSTKCAIPTVTNICKQPSSYQHGYGPGKPVGGVELPVVTCNDLKDQFSQAPFKLYTESDSRKCGAFPRNKLPEACAAACKAQYEECIDVYAEGCKQKKRRGETYFDIAAADAEEKSKRWFNWKDSYTTAVNKCKAQYYDCKSENKYANAGSKCFSWGHGW